MLRILLVAAVVLALAALLSHNVRLRIAILLIPFWKKKKSGLIGTSPRVDRVSSENAESHGNEVALEAASEVVAKFAKFIEDGDLPRGYPNTSFLPFPRDAIRLALMTEYVLVESTSRRGLLDAMLAVLSGFQPEGNAAPPTPLGPVEHTEARLSNAKPGPEREKVVGSLLASLGVTPNYKQLAALAEREASEWQSRVRRSIDKGGARTAEGDSILLEWSKIVPFILRGVPIASETPERKPSMNQQQERQAHGPSWVSSKWQLPFQKPLDRVVTRILDANESERQLPNDYGSQWRRVAFMQGLIWWREDFRLLSSLLDQANTELGWLMSEVEITANVNLELAAIDPHSRHFATETDPLRTFLAGLAFFQHKAGNASGNAGHKWFEIVLGLYLVRMLVEKDPAAASKLAPHVPPWVNIGRLRILLELPQS